MKKVAYWVASHLTGIFEIRDKANDVMLKGSRGAGLCIKRGVKTSITHSESNELEIYFNGKRVPTLEAIVTKKVIDLELPPKSSCNFKISHEFEVPIKGGFGTSAAGALGTAYCLNDFLKLNLSELSLFQIAHQAEVQTKSGLGDIIGLYQGGLEIRVKEGAPGIGQTIPIKMSDKWKLATVYFGSLSTAAVLSDPSKRKAVNKAGSKILDELIKKPEFEFFAKLSRDFTNKVKLYSKQLVKRLRELPDSVIGAQVMLGDTMILYYQDEDVIQELRGPDFPIQPESISDKSIMRLS